ncbi:MAG: ricin-type beta-trefoil lectin domain protein [Acidimicrobiales bacterium]|nr:ricin-type beta-trefoil lectin domain protein [Acidimicrobiales bacterium]
MRLTHRRDREPLRANHPVVLGGDEAGETLVETLASVLLTGLVVVALLGGLLSALRAATTQRTVANAEVAARNYVEALNDAPYIACATPAFYENPAGFDPVSGTSLRVTSVQGWVRDSEPATFAPFETGCFDDTGLQEVTFEVDGPGSGDHLVRRVLKRYDGNSDGLVGAPVPGDAVRCTVEAAADTTVDTGNPTSSFGTDDSMTLGTGGSGEQAALVRFDINPGTTSCLEGGTLPGGLQVQGATMRFFTSRIVGSPDCGTSCWHTVDQVEDSWSESTTWNTRPSLLAGAGTGTVEHGTGTGDYTPRYQLLSTRELTDQVSTFYRLPDLNHGWQISRACAPAHPEHTCDTARFQIRSREWSVPLERPLLSIVLAPSLTDAKQIRNVGIGGCASVFDDSRSDAGELVAFPCSGRGWQSFWSTSGRYKGVNSGKCFETGNVPTAGTRVAQWGCHDNNWQKWVVDGAAIKYAPDQTKCLAIRGGSTVPGTKLEIAVCDGSPSQRWVVEPVRSIPPPSSPIRLYNAGGDNCLDVDINKTQDDLHVGDWAQAYPCLGETRTSQSFTFTTDGRLVSSKERGLCLGWNDTDSRTNLVTVQNCDQYARQQWFLQGTQLINLRNGKCLQGGRDIDWIRLESCFDAATNPAKQWTFEPASAPARAVPVRYRNRQYGDCMQPASLWGNGQSMIGVPCGGAGNGQSVLRTRKGEIRFTDQHPVCIQVNSAATNNPVNIWTCDQQPDDNNPSNTHQQFEYTSGGQLKIVGGARGCAEGLGDGRTVYLRTCDSNNQAQIWDEEIVDDTAFPVQQISNVQTGSCLEYPVTGSNAVASPCAGPAATRQGFVWFANGHIRRSASINQCLKANGSGNDSTLTWADCDGTKNEQLWDRTDRGDGTFRLSTRQSGARCIEGSWDARDVKLRDCSNSAWQGWKFEAQTDSRTIVQVRNVLDNSCMDVPNGITQGSNVFSLPCDPANNPGQALVEYQVGTGLLELRFRDNPGVCIDVNGDGATGKVMLAWNCNRGASQRFRTPGDALQILNGSDSATGRCEGYDDATGTIRSQTCQYASPGGPPIDRQIFRREAIGSTGTSQAISLRLASGGGTCVDIDANTATGYSQGVGLVGFPCLATWRNNQAFVLGSNGLVRSAVTPSLCLDANGGGNGSTLLLWGCDSSNQNQIWRFDAGRLRNLRGSTLSRCVTVSGDGAAATTTDCTTGADQQITTVPFGSAPRAGAVGRIRQDNDCLEASQLPDSGNTPQVWSYPCSIDRLGQQVIQLNNGQFRARNNTTRCLDANHGWVGEGLKFDACHVPASSNPQQAFDLAGTLRTRATEGGVRRCVTHEGAGASVLQQVCGGSGQDWYFEELS